MKGMPVKYWVLGCWHDCIWPSWCHCHSLSLDPKNPDWFFPFWYRLTRVVPDKGPLNGCCCNCWWYYHILKVLLCNVGKHLASSIWIRAANGTFLHHLCPVLMSVRHTLFIIYFVIAAGICWCCCQGEPNNRITFTKTEPPAAVAPVWPSDIRLVDDFSVHVGRLQVMYKHKWRGICANHRKYVCCCCLSFADMVHSSNWPF